MHVHACTAGVRHAVLVMMRRVIVCFSYYILLWLRCATRLSLWRSLSTADAFNAHLRCDIVCVFEENNSSLGSSAFCHTTAILRQARFRYRSILAFTPALCWIAFSFLAMAPKKVQNTVNKKLRPAGPEDEVAREELSTALVLAEPLQAAGGTRRKMTTCGVCNEPKKQEPYNFE